MLFTQDNNEQWTSINKVLFRFVFIYFAAYGIFLLASPILDIPVRIFAEYALQMDPEFSVRSSGSGDRTYDFVKLAMTLAFSTLIFGLFSILNKQKIPYNELLKGLLIFLRVFLFLAMLLYGFAKIFKAQFPAPSFLNLLQPLGEKTPMGLAWTFMGYSFYYNLFIGFAEALGGILMIYKRTSTLGSLIICGVMGNVMVMNLTYDIPVKLFSIHLFLMAFTIMITDSKRLLAFFFLDKTVNARFIESNVKTGIANKLISGFKFLLVFIVIGAVVVQIFLQYEFRGRSEGVGKFYGIWEAKLFIQNQDTVPPLITDNNRWRYLIIDNESNTSIKFMTDLVERYRYETDSTTSEFILSTRQGKDPKYFNYIFNNPQELILKKYDGEDSLYIKFNRKVLTDFRLYEKGFRWINEYPDNR